jgi:hypothetical protein
MRQLALAVIVALALCQGPAARGQTELDRTLATVNGDLVLKSDVLWNLALDPEVAPAEFWDAKVQEMMLRTLIDQRILLQEALKLPTTRATDEEILAEITNLAAQFNSADDTMRFEKRLELVGLTGPRLARIVRARLRITKFIDFRFRSFVVVTEPEIHAYFDAEIRPKLPDRTEAAANAALEAQRKAIEQLLVEEKINNSIDVFLDDARARAEVVRLYA